MSRPPALARSAARNRSDGLKPSWAVNPEEGRRKPARQSEGGGGAGASLAAAQGRGAEPLWGEAA